MDNGPEFTSRAELAWRQQTEVNLHFIQPGKPTENAIVESFNGRFRDECLNQRCFIDLDHARRIIDEWTTLYHEHRPHRGAGRDKTVLDVDFVPKTEGRIRCRTELGGILKSYFREAA